jgi:hypothetical protein
VKQLIVLLAVGLVVEAIIVVCPFVIALTDRRRGHGGGLSVSDVLDGLAQFLSTEWSATYRKSRTTSIRLPQWCPRMYAHAPWPRTTPNAVWWRW